MADVDEKPSSPAGPLRVTQARNPSFLGRLLQPRLLVLLVAVSTGLSLSMPDYGKDYLMYWHIGTMIAAIPLAALLAFAIGEIPSFPRPHFRRLFTSLLIGEVAFVSAWRVALIVQPYLLGTVGDGLTTPAPFGGASVTVACIMMVLPWRQESRWSTPKVAP